MNQRVHPSDSDQMQDFKDMPSGGKLGKQACMTALQTPARTSWSQLHSPPSLFEQSIESTKMSSAV